MKLTSPAFTNKGKIPIPYTCLGPNINPPLHFHDVPKATESFTLIVEDKDTTPKPWVHWLVFNIDGSVKRIEENAVPITAIEGLANGGKPGYEGPCPKYFQGTHHYTFTLYALDHALSIPKDSDVEKVRHAMKDHLLATAELVGLCTSNKK